MKKVTFLFAALFAFTFVFQACQNSGSTETTNEETVTTDTVATEEVVEEEVAIAEELTDDVKARNIYKNTTVILSGSMVISFGNILGDQAQAINEAFGTGNTAEIDAKIASLPAETMAKLDDMKNKMDSVFDAMKTEHEAIYNKMFQHELMAEGIEIANKYELPEGFEPLTANMDETAMRRYIIKISSADPNGDATEDVILNMYKEIFEWMQK